MSRNLILATGALLWAVAVADAAVHLVSGDLVAPALMVVAGIAGVAFIGLRRGRGRMTEDA
jgi:hypothetical protein